MATKAPNIQKSPPTKEHPLKIGLEIHGYLNTNEKLFCKCQAKNEDEPNTHICPICTGQPGSKPMLPNKQAIEQFIKIASILKCKINTDQPLYFNRKHYSWPDNPKGYQTTISGSHTKFPAEKGNYKDIGIWECHIEEDPAQWNPKNGHINYNRSGLPLIEIVTAPDFKSIPEVIQWLKSLILSLSYIKAIKKNAGIKVDCNISTYGQRVEIKNLNSLDSIQKALTYEQERQIEAHQNNEELPQETRTYDPTKGKTLHMRTKEDAADYRFIVDPDLPTITIEKKLVQTIQKNIPETPEQKLTKLIKTLKIPPKDADIITKNLELVEFVEELQSEKINIPQNINWITVELLRILNYNKKTLDDAEIDILPKHMAELIQSVENKQITPLKAKQIMNDFIPKSFSITEKDDITQIADDAVQNICQQVINENTKAVNDYQNGEQNALNYLVGQVMKKSNRRADFKTATEELKKILDN